MVCYWMATSAIVQESKLIAMNSHTAWFSLQNGKWQRWKPKQLENLWVFLTSSSLLRGLKHGKPMEAEADIEIFPFLNTSKSLPKRKKGKKKHLKKIGEIAVGSRSAIHLNLFLFVYFNDFRYLLKLTLETGNMGFLSWGCFFPTCTCTKQCE